MKKILGLVLSLTMLFSAIGVSAAKVVEEFNIDDAQLSSYGGDDEVVLMEMDVKAELERRLIEAWTNMSSYVPDTVTEEVDMPENAVYISDLKIEKTDIAALFALISFENPMFYYVEKKFTGATVKGKTYMGYIVPRYTETDKSVIEATWAEIDKATEEILLYINPDMTDVEKVMAVHDYMVFRYDYNIEDPDQTMMIILDREGVCAAYAAAFLHVMNVLGIECSVVRSNDMGHIWNIVKIDNEWYHVDVTWDDLTEDRVTAINHEHVLLSTDAIMEKGHYGLDMAGYTADSTIYDDAPWQEGKGAVVSIDGVMYYVNGNNLVDENGNIIYKDLDGGDDWWNVAKNAGVEGDVFAGLCEINGVLYFNTDTAIYSYDPKTKDMEAVYESYGICGIFADGNKIKFDLYDMSTGGFLVEELRIADVELAEPYYEDGKAVVRLYNDSDSPLWVISDGDAYKLAEITEKGVNTIKLDNGEEQAIYVWKNSMEPIGEKILVNE